MFHIQVKSFKINYIKHPGCLQKATFSYKGAVTMPIILAINYIVYHSSIPIS